MRATTMIHGVVLAMLALAPTLTAQFVGLPGDLLAHTDPELAPVTTFATPSSPTHESWVSVGYNNRGTAKTVSLLWRVRHGTATPLREERVESLSYSPIAVTAAAGTTNRMFVAGWSERDELVIEQWTVPSPIAVAQTINPATGVASTTAIIPRISRVEIARLDEPGPVWSIAVNPHGGTSGRLLLLSHQQSGAVTANVWEFDIATRTLLDASGVGAPSPLWTHTANPGIQQRANIWAANIPPLGFVILVTDDKPFNASQQAKFYSFFIDSNLDGAYEGEGVVTRHEFLQAHPHATWAPYSDA